MVFTLKHSGSIVSKELFTIPPSVFEYSRSFMFGIILLETENTGAPSNEQCLPLLLLFSVMSLKGSTSLKCGKGYRDPFQQWRKWPKGAQWRLHKSTFDRILLGLCLDSPLRGQNTQKAEVGSGSLPFIGEALTMFLSDITRKVAKTVHQEHDCRPPTQWAVDEQLLNEWMSEGRRRLHHQIGGGVEEEAGNSLLSGNESMNTCSSQVHGGWGITGEPGC